MPHFDNFVKLTGTVGPAANRTLCGKRILVATLLVSGGGGSILVHVDNPDRTLVRSVWQPTKLLTVTGRLCFNEGEPPFIYAEGAQLLCDPVKSPHVPWPKNEVGDRKEYLNAFRSNAHARR